MKFTDVIKISLDNLVRNRRRAALTMLGIVIGVMSVILMLSVGQAAENYILSQVSSFGSDLLIVRNGPGDGGTGSGPPTMTVKQTLTLKDYEKLKKQSWVSAINASVISDFLVEYEASTITTRISGVSPDDMLIFNTTLSQGSFISQDAFDSAAKVAVLGKDVANDLFGQEDPINKRIKIQKKAYRVIGVMNEAGTRFFTNLDKSVYVPTTALMQDTNKDRLQFMYLKISGLETDEAKERIRVLLRENHNLDNPEGDLSKDDFFIAGQEDTAAAAGMIGSILQVLLASIAAISLVVGGVGIMNIMFVTVTERTREIGLRKALGAKKADIRSQFLYEAIMLCLTGGLIGVAAGIGLSWSGIKLLQELQSPNWIFTIPMDGVVMGLTVSTLIGVVFGYFPAKRASDLDPIEALQYE
ncbi:MAG TPA: ABC transporter permease [bacterium]|nr:MAG: Macrolide export ATP-binding/permease protein MacB [Parcubacteria group bacterium ADurb.Bin192]HPN14918.1 ABC transporter permease [bacterium]